MAFCQIAIDISLGLKIFKLWIRYDSEHKI